MVHIATTIHYGAQYRSINDSLCIFGVGQMDYFSPFCYKSLRSDEAKKMWGMSKMASAVEWRRDKISPPQDGACCIIDPAR